MKTLKNLIKIAVPVLVLSASNFKSYGQDTLKTKEGYEISFGNWQTLTYNKKNQLMKKFLKNGDFKHTHFYEYDDKGQRIKDEWFITYKNEKSEKEITSLYFYNSNGNVNMEIRIDKKGENEVIKYNSK
ncbi:MAG: hypothetical protein QT10_C0006G0027 [archaeon GW2011_AR19]|nr:MAG: hypothetical protein QT10_C0006G0027 [archaeon GW2011_AR19]